MGSCALLLLALVGLQIEHLAFFVNEIDALTSPIYRFWLSLVPPMFFFFSRAILLPDSPTPRWMLIHLVPLLLNVGVFSEIVVPGVFVVGSGYCLWLAYMIYGLKGQRKRFNLEIFFSGLFAVQAVLVLIFGFAIPYVDNAYFYIFYSNCISLAFLLIVAALMVFPDLLAELAEAAKISYATTTLTGLDVDTYLEKLEGLMLNAKIYQNEQLNLSMLADEMGLTGHQLSELINVHFGIGFSRYIREQRIQAAKALLIDEPKASVLSIGLETGFKSQSNFYAAFKEIEGQSPGGFRKTHLPSNNI